MDNNNQRDSLRPAQNTTQQSNARQYAQQQSRQTQGQYTPRHVAPKGKSSGSKTGLTVVLCVLAALILVAGTLLAVKALNSKQPQESLASTDQATQAPTESQAPANSDPAQTAEPSEEATEEPTEAPYMPDLELLDAMGKNNEIIGRLTYGDEAGQYITYTNNNDYYMTHDAFGNYKDAGAPFIDCRNTLSPRDTNLMIHGHNKNAANSGTGEVFANLFKFQTKSYLAEYPIFTLETGVDKQVYVPYALAYGVETNPNMPGYYRIIEWNFDSDSDFDSYTGYMIDKSLYELPVDVQPDDNLLTLSTCINDGNNYTEIRLLVCLRQLREGESVEEMTKLFQEKLG